MTPVGRGSALISWSGSMFEYLMPALVMRAPALSLLEQTHRLVVARQMSYAAGARRALGHLRVGVQRTRDLALTYQYSSFGVPGLGLKRGLSEDVVVAPYATALAAMIQPKAAVRNFARLSDAGARDRYGFREALDYTPRRLPEGAVGRGREELHGPSPGDGTRGPGQRPQQSRDGGALPCGPDRRGDGAAAPGADAARRARGPAACRRGEERRRGARSRPAGPSPFHLAARLDAAYARAVERAVCGHGHGRGIRLQPLARHGRDPLARGRDPRLVGQLSLPARHGDRRGVVGGSPAERHGSGQLRGRLLRGSGRVLASRRIDCHAPDGGGVGGARRRDPPRVADESRFALSPDRADLVCRDRACAAGGRCRASGLPEPVRRDGVRGRYRGSSGDPPAEIQRREADLGRPRRGGRGRGQRRHPVRDGSRQLPRSRSFGPNGRSRSSTGVRSPTRSGRCWIRSSA
jgi:hypothetical protein